ncbi:hypothetical protein GQ607_011306 [Colletotrichum asianum]|uniref:Uncharacterized protein n=1 Tax=Colletotrichum asianum TaxID=702518 RepID=A0A8H3W971_9PEZI|nr:hypothetical protein GQ607_011306 [Colletotrichum asianum]
MAMDECPKDFPLVVVLIVDPLPAAREHIIPPKVFLTTSSVYHHSKHQAVCATPIPISRSHFGAFIRPPSPPSIRCFSRLLCPLPVDCLSAGLWLCCLRIPRLARYPAELAHSPTSLLIAPPRCYS